MRLPFVGSTNSGESRLGGHTRWTDSTHSTEEAMNRHLLLLALGSALVSLGATDPSAQSRPTARPDLSGKWTLAATPGVIADAPLFTEGVITQDALSVTFTSGARSLTYRLDVPESRNTQTSARGEGNYAGIPGALGHQCTFDHDQAQPRGH